MNSWSSAGRLGASSIAKIVGSIARISAADRLAVVAVSLTSPSREKFGLNAAASLSEVNQSFIHSPLKAATVAVVIPALLLEIHSQARPDGPDQNSNALTKIQSCQ